MAYTPAQLSLLGKYKDPFNQQVANGNSTYNATVKNISQQNSQQLAEKSQAQAAAVRSQEGANANAYATYRKALNPYGRNGDVPNNVGEYTKNAAMGTYLGSLGQNQLAYNNAMQNANTLWQNWLSQKAGQEADALKAKQDSADNYYQYYLGLKRDDDAAAQAQANADREFYENQRQFNLQFNKSYGGGSSGGSGGGNGSEDYDFSGNNGITYGTTDKPYNLANPDGPGAQGQPYTVVKTQGNRKITKYYDKYGNFIRQDSHLVLGNTSKNAKSSVKKLITSSGKKYLQNVKGH